MKYLPLLLLLCGCQIHTLSDGTKIRVDRFPGFVTPSIVTVSTRPSGSTNWTTPQVVSGPGLINAASSGVAIVIPTGRGQEVKVDASASSASSSTATAPKSGFPPGHNKDGWGNKGR